MKNKTKKKKGFFVTKDSLATCSEHAVTQIPMEEIVLKSVTVMMLRSYWAEIR